MSLILPDGIHDNISAEAYHADPCPEPSVSSSLIKSLCLDSPAHAKAMHPRLTTEITPDDSEKFDIGTAAHAILLEGRNAVEIIDAKDWRTNAAKEAREAARAAGKIPLLAKVWKDVEAMVHATRAQLDDHRGQPPFFLDGKPEQTLIWLEDGLWCRARLDWLRDDRQTIDDYKSTSATANPETWSRTLFGHGFDIQAAWYLRGLRALTGAEAQFRFVVQETYPPYALSVIALGPDAMTLAEKKILYALDVWRECVQANHWPAYPNQVCYATLPVYEESRWLDKETR